MSPFWTQTLSPQSSYEVDADGWQLPLPRSSLPWQCRGEKAQPSSLSLECLMPIPALELWGFSEAALQPDCSLYPNHPPSLLSSKVLSREETTLWQTTCKHISVSKSGSQEEELRAEETKSPEILYSLPHTKSEALSMTGKQQLWFSERTLSWGLQ